MRYKPTYNDGLTKDQRYYRRHREEPNNSHFIKNNKKYYQEHKDYWKKFGKNRDKEKHQEICRKYRTTLEYKEYKKEYRNKNRLAYRAYWHNRRSNERGLTKKILQIVYEDNIKQYGTLTCCLCLKPIEFGQDSLEHKIPLSRGGTNAKENLAIAHKSCNFKKHPKTVEEYLSLINSYSWTLLTGQFV